MRQFLLHDWLSATPRSTFATTLVQRSHLRTSQGSSDGSSVDSSNGSSVGSSKITRQGPSDGSRQGHSDGSSDSRFTIRSNPNQCSTSDGVPTAACASSSTAVHAAWNALQHTLSPSCQDLIHVNTRRITCFPKMEVCGVYSMGLWNAKNDSVIQDPFPWIGGVVLVSMTAAVDLPCTAVDPLLAPTLCSACQAMIFSA
jgi:hypothetical protein